jgi:hypothetical protein
VAKEYIIGKYYQEMEFKKLFILSLGMANYSGDRNIFPGNDYMGTHATFFNIVFSPIDDDNIRFSVLVSYDLSYIVDDYYITRLSNYFEKYFQLKIEDMWIDNIVYININNRYDYIFNPPIEYDQDINLEDIKHFNDFYIRVITNCILNNINMEDESKKILKTIEVIKENNYNPNYIQFMYQNIGIRIDSWNTILNYQEIIKIANDRFEEIEEIEEMRNIRNNR